MRAKKPDYEKYFTGIRFLNLYKYKKTKQILYKYKKRNKFICRLVSKFILFKKQISSANLYNYKMDFDIDSFLQKYIRYRTEIVDAMNFDDEEREFHLDDGNCGAIVNTIEFILSKDDEMIDIDVKDIRKFISSGFFIVCQQNWMIDEESIGHIYLLVGNEQEIYLIESNNDGDFMCEKLSDVEKFVTIEEPIRHGYSPEFELNLEFYAKKSLPINGSSVLNKLNF